MVQNLGATWSCVAASLRCTSGTVPSNLQTSAPVLPAPADATALLGTGATPGAKFMTLFQLTVRLSNVVATAEPGPGRSFAGSTSGGIGSSDRAAELAVMRLVLGGADDASFVAGLADPLANPLPVGPSPARTLDGARLGLGEGGDGGAAAAEQLLRRPLAGGGQPGRVTRARARRRAADGGRPGAAGLAAPPARLQVGPKVC